MDLVQMVVRPGNDTTLQISGSGVAVIEGIDRAQPSQVTTFVERHGDHSVQHVAFNTDDLQFSRATCSRWGVYHVAKRSLVTTGPEP